jgi:hypothetical protein
MLEGEVGNDVTETSAFLVKVLKVRQDQGHIQVRTLRQFDSSIRASIRAKNIKSTEAIAIKGLELLLEGVEDGPNPALSPMRYLPKACFERLEVSRGKRPGWDGNWVLPGEVESHPTQ